MSFVKKNYTLTCPIEEVLGIWMETLLRCLSTILMSAIYRENIISSILNVCWQA
jgi:hypothetical protein